MRLYLAACDNRPELMEEFRPPYILASFEALKNKKRRETVLSLIKNDWCKDVMIDSGAFSFSPTGYGGANTSVEWERYVDAYSDFILASGVEHFFEMDVDYILGLEKVEELRRRIERRTGKQTIPVWHMNRGWKYFERMCDEYKYVSIGGVAKNPNGPKITKTFPYFIECAHKKGCQIHGLGYTDVKNFKVNPFDSVDSSSWSTGSRYSVSYEMKGHALTSHKNIYPGKRIDGKSLDRHNLEIWVKYARSIDYQR